MSAKKTDVYAAVCRRLLREASGTGAGLAAHVEKTSNGMVATVYDPADGDKVIGFVNVAAPRGAPCRGAWQVKGIAGPGRVVYTLAYALSPTGLVVPDRSSVSPSASSAWKKYSALVGGGQPLDDADHPKTGTDAAHDAAHTQDPSDDCYTSHEEPWLNAAYTGRGDEAEVLRRMQAAHEAAAQGHVDDREEWESALTSAGFDFFDAVAP